MSQARILIVEDDRIVARDIQQQLARMGHVVVGISATGEDAVSLATDRQPDLVLMDIRLEGEMDGIEAARRIRDRHQIPIIFLTAYANDETVYRASLTEPFGYLLKPFEVPQMRAVIQMALYKHAADARIRMTERRYEATLASIGDGVIVCDNEARVDFINRVAEALTGWPSADALGQPADAVLVTLDEESRGRLDGAAGLVLRQGASARHERRSVLLARDGTESAIEERCSPIIDDRGAIAGAVLVFSDVTQRRQVAEALRKAEAELVHVGRLTLMGELAAAIAHEVNQPLMAIITNAGTCLQYLSREQPDLTRSRTAVERIIRDAQRAGNVVRSIQALSRRAPAEPGRIDLNAVILDTLSLVQAELRQAGVQLSTGLAPDLPAVHGDRVQLQQVLLNLVMNAVEAMLPVETRLLRITTGMLDGLVLTSVEDTGVGIDPALTDTVFKALFTTKPDGMGMGLSISRSIVELHDGRLSVRAGLPCGSVFEFVLPAAGDGEGA
jgi:two-component system, cell cycle sensor histidine kinase and response regulator CckA